MPTYQYACTTCDHRFEAVQSFSDDALTECPECTGRVRKLFSSVGIVFKGSGFYRTDSRSNGEKKPAESGSAKESSSSSSASATKDSGPASSGSSSGSGSSSSSSGGSSGGSSSSSGGSSTATSAA